MEGKHVNCRFGNEYDKLDPRVAIETERLVDVGQLLCLFRLRTTKH